MSVERALAASPNFLLHLDPSVGAALRAASGAASPPVVALFFVAPGFRKSRPRTAWRKEYRITDHLASLRATLNLGGTETGTYDYEPFGDPLT